MQRFYFDTSVFGAVFDAGFEEVLYNYLRE
jgi:hypothetical protein